MIKSSRRSVRFSDYIRNSVLRRKDTDTMKRFVGVFLLLVIFMLSLASCESIGEIVEQSIQTTESGDTADESESGEPSGKVTTASSEGNPTPTVNGNAVKEIGEIKTIFSETATPTEFTVGEDRYDLDCTAFLYGNTDAATFPRFLSDLEEHGFTLYATNGENGINGFCRQATLYNDYFTVNVTRYAKTQETYITVEAKRDLSPLQIKPETRYYGTNTVFHNPKHPNTPSGKYAFGELDIFQLSNNHFVVVDGAQEYSSQMFVEYLENLVGEGNTPIIDAWFFTHAHPDHIYCCWGVGRNANLVDRIRVNGFYYTFPNDKGVRRESDYDGLKEQIANFNSVLGNFQTVDGKVTPKYKLHAGMTFYIDELKVEILMTQDQLMPEEYKSFNDSSTSFKFTVYSTGNVQTTFLIMGDANTPVCNAIMLKYDYNTLHTNFFTSLHHGNNDCAVFFAFIAPDYLIYTAPSKKTSTGYEWLNKNCKEYFVAPSVIHIPYQ